MTSQYKIRFISVPSGDPKPAVRDAKSRRLIRTRAARAARSHDIEERSQKHYKQSVAVKTVSQHGGMNRFRSQPSPAATKPSSNTSYSVSPLKDQLPVWNPVIGPLGDQAWELLHYYRYLFRSRSWAINAKRDWFAFIIEDPAATHATLSFVALNRDLEEGGTISTWSLNHRYKALQLVRRQLAEDKGAPKDSLIGAVALLAITEGLEGQSTSSSAHVEALTKLVDLRGGLAKLQKNEALSRLVAWADLCHVSTFSDGPRLPSLFNQVDIALDQDHIEPEVDCENMFQRTMQKMMPHKVFYMVRLLSLVPKYPPSETTTSQERQKVSRLIYYINQTLLSIHHEDANFDTGPAGKLARVLCYAAHLYISLALRQMPRRTMVVVERAARLRTAIYELESVVVWDKHLIEPYLVISLWAQTLHFCSLPLTQRLELHNAGLKSTLATLAITNLEQYNCQLSRISWVWSSFDDELRCILG